MISDTFKKITSRDSVYNIQAINNISSIIKKGLLSFDTADEMQHVSVALSEIQDRREGCTVTNGLRLHQYVSLYFDYWNPMLSRLRDKNQQLCILIVDIEILNLDGIVMTDMNASSEYVSFYSPQEGLSNIDFDLVYSKRWTDENQFRYFRKKSVKCAEILVPYILPYKYIKGAIVYNENSKLKLMQNGFNKEIIVDKTSFFE